MNEKENPECCTGFPFLSQDNHSPKSCCQQHHEMKRQHLHRIRTALRQMDSRGTHSIPFSFTTMATKNKKPTAQESVDDTDDPWFSDEDDYETIYEDSDFMLPDEGYHEAEIIDVEQEDFPFKEGEPGEKWMKLKFRLDSTYEDDDGEQKHYFLRSKGIRYRYGEKANLVEIFSSLTGRSPLTVSRERQLERNGKQMRGITFPRSIFNGMRCQVLVEHKEGEKRTYANIERCKATPEQRRGNCELVDKFMSQAKEQPDSTTDDE